MPIGRASSLASQSSWKKISACARVLWKISVVRCARTCSSTSAIAYLPPPPDQGARASLSSIADVGVGAGIGVEDLAGIGMAREEGRHRGRILDRGGEADAAQPGRQPLQPREAQHHLVAALRFGQRVDLVDDHPLQAAEHPSGILVGQKQREALGRRQQDMRRVRALPPLLRRGRVAGAVLDPDREAHLGDGRAEVAPDVGGQRLQGRDVEGVQPGSRRRPEFDQRRQEPRERLAAAGGRDQQERRCVLARQHLGLVRMGGPAAGGEPAVERIG